MTSENDNPAIGNEPAQVNPVPMEPARARPIVPLLPYQRDDVESDARFRWNCWARQTGKSFTKSLRRLLRGLVRRRNQVFLSAGERQARELIDKTRMHCQALKIAADSVGCDALDSLRVGRLEIALPGHVRVIALPANPQTIRGYTGDVFLDEFAMHADDRDIWASIFPTLLRGDGELDIASTPRGRGNLFYELQFNDRFVQSTITLPQAIEHGLNADVEEMRRAMNDDMLFRQEFLCEFLDEASAFLTFQQIDACVDPLLHPSVSGMALSEETRELFVGVDVGRVRDLTVIWVFAKDHVFPVASDPSTRESPLTTVGLIELGQTPFQKQFDILCELMSLRLVRKCCIDSGGLGMQLAEQLVERFGGYRVEPVTFTSTMRSQLAGGLRVAVESRRIRIPANEAIRRDWHSVERHVSADGNFRLIAPRREGSHADRFWAAALAVRAASENTGSIEAQFRCPRIFAREGIW